MRACPQSQAMGLPIAAISLIAAATLATSFVSGILGLAPGIIQLSHA